MQILHITPENTAGVPYNVMKMQNDYGYKSRLISFYNRPFDFPEDICLNINLQRGNVAMLWRRYKQKKLHNEIRKESSDSLTYLPYFAPNNVLEQFYMKLREKKNEKKFLDALELVKADTSDIIHFDSGIDYYSDCRLAKKWKNKGKKIVNCYFGDDLRTRGIIKEMDELSDLNLTFEYDHTMRHQNINFLYHPFDAKHFKFIDDEIYNRTCKLRIVHSPTDKFIKGTQEIIQSIDKIKSKFDFDFVLLENLPREKVLEEKSKCHIAIDQIGNRGGTGYGINSLETLSMGIPTITDMNCGMAEWLPENPFIVANKDNLAATLAELITDVNARISMRKAGRIWVEKYHSYSSVMNKLNEYYKQLGII